MNLEKIFDGFVLLTGLECTEAAKWLPLCRTAMEEINERLADGADKESNGILLNSCASAGAFLKYAIVTSSHSESNSFSAGDVKISKNSSSKLVESAKLLYSESLKCISDLFRDNGFFFKEMSVQ
ncbi:MAG: hypothetical protein IJL87_05665 [Clostridia bacterium]|nr:hypothetical protein [Clostridia bacterium]